MHYSEEFMCFVYIMRKMIKIRDSGEEAPIDKI